MNHPTQPPVDTGAIRAMLRDGELIGARVDHYVERLCDGVKHLTGRVDNLIDQRDAGQDHRDEVVRQRDALTAENTVLRSDLDASRQAHTDEVREIIAENDAEVERLAACLDEAVAENAELAAEVERLLACDVPEVWRDGVMRQLWDAMPESRRAELREIDRCVTQHRPDAGGSV